MCVQKCERKIVKKITALDGELLIGERVIEEIILSFDFIRVMEIKESMDWPGFAEMTAVSEARMARNLLRDALRIRKTNGDAWPRVSCGGYRAEIAGDELALLFIPVQHEEPLPSTRKLR